MALASASVTFWPAAALLLNALVWGLSWWPFRELAAHGLHPLWASAIVFSFVTVGLLVWRPSALRLLVQHRGLWWIALAAGGTNVCFNWAITTGEVLRVILLFYLMPIWAAIFGWILLGERITQAAVLRMVIAVAGAALVLLPDGRWGVPLPASLPDWLGLAGGAIFAMNTVLLRKHSGIAPQGRILAICAGGVLMPGALAIFGWSWGYIAGLPAPQLEWLALAAVFGLVILAGNLGLQFGMRHIAAGTAGLIMLTEVPIAALTAAWWAGEQMTTNVVAGGVLIALSAVLALRR